MASKSLPQKEKKSKKIKIMEVCGTHTMSVAKYGLRNYFKNTLLISGPGCPVCVTPSGRLEQCVRLSVRKNVIITTFGDMLRVPSITSSLEKSKSAGADVRVVYSAYEPLKIALDNKDREVVFAGAGFETTAPLAAVLIEEAFKKNIKNFSLFSMFKSVFPVLETLCSDKEFDIDGFLLPGNVAAVTGWKDFIFLSEKYGIPSVAAGFSDTEIVRAVNSLSNMIRRKEAGIKNEYGAVVSPEGNITAKNLLEKVFYLENDRWRGFGKVSKSGFRLRDKYAAFDADKKFSIPEIKEKKDACLCGDIMKGFKTPVQCGLYSKICNPSNPVGPCMVSSEGVCAAYYRYGNK